eukprot:Lithocolla_globosa_v1_NODE_84_length_6699_cov_54.834938.p8 type:complete len:130 gc:universal NODE_84_length_6699_cov_54.834938:4861-5250(+)
MVFGITRVDSLFGSAQALLFCFYHHRTLLFRGNPNEVPLNLTPITLLFPNLAAWKKFGWRMRVACAVENLKRHHFHEGCFFHPHQSIDGFVIEGVRDIKNALPLAQTLSFFARGKHNMCSHAHMIAREV